MSLTRRDAIAQMSALFALPLVRWTSDSTEPLDGTITAYQAGRARGAWSALEVTIAARARCMARGGPLHAIDQMCDTALGEARASDERLRRGELRGPLDGVPVFAKSIYDVGGLPTTGSSAEWAQLFPAAVQRDALEVVRMRAAGAVLLGKTAADDFAYRGNGTSSLTGQVRNPFDVTGTRTPGGSSAGSAVAVACGMAFAALGTDDGGSNRIPAQFTGVVGMKPTFGLVPRTGVIPTWPYLDTHGPLARSVADAAVLLNVITGPDASDGLALRTPWPGIAIADWRDDALRGARLGVVETHVPRTQMSAESLTNFDRALADLRDGGAELDLFVPPVTRHDYRDRFKAASAQRGDVVPDPKAPGPTANALLRYFGRHHADAAHDVERGLAAFRAFYDVLPTTWTDMNRLVAQPYEHDAAGRSFARSRAELIALLSTAFRAARIDAMVYPTMPFPAPLASAGWPDVPTTLGYGNWLGLPEVSVPGGLSSDGMPAGNLSFVGLPGSDVRLLSLAHAYEQRSMRFTAPPSY